MPCLINKQTTGKSLYLGLMFTLNLFEYVEKSCCKMVNFDGAVEEEKTTFI